MALAVVVWSFVHVGVRTVRQWQAEGRGTGATVLTVMHWGNAEEVEIVEKLVAQYEAGHPDVRIKRVHAPSDRYMAKLKTMYAAGTPPDLFYLSYDNIPEFAEGRMLADVGEMIAAEQEAGRAGWVEDFYPKILDAFRYDGTHAGAGPLYGLPKDFSTMGMYVNLELFERAGIAVPYGGWTWDDYERITKRISTTLNTADTPATERIYGGTLNTYSGMLFNIIWCHGGEVFADGGRNFTELAIDEPAAQAALERVRRVRMGPERAVYRAPDQAVDVGQQLFFDGKIAIVGPLGPWMVPRYRKIESFRWDVVPLPVGEREASRIATVAWAMRADVPAKGKAFELMRFLCGPEGQRMSARMGLAVPSLKSVAESEDFLQPQQHPRNMRVFLDAIPHGRIVELPKEKEFVRYFDDELSSTLVLDRATPGAAAARLEARWKGELASPLRARHATRMPWGVLAMGAAGVLLAVIALGWWRSRGLALGPIERSHQRAGWLFIMPWVVGFVCLTVGPMLFSLALSFSRWTAITPVGEARFVGLANYQHMVTYDREAFMQSLWVTAYYVLLAVPVGQVLALGVALLMNAAVKGIGLFRTAFFIPSIIGAVTSTALWFRIFNKDYGLLNALLRPVLEPLGMTPPDWLGHDAHSWAIPAFVIMNLWAVGGGMIIYLAALKSIPASYYEAARIDGASRPRQFWNITLPMLSPIIFFNVVMALIGSFQVFTPAYMLTQGGPDNATLFYVFNLFQHAFEFHNMGYASALAWVLFVIVLLLTLLVFRGSRKVVYYEALKS